MKQPAGRQMQVYLKDKTYRQVIDKAEEFEASASSVGREAIEFTLNSPLIEWINGKPVIKKDRN